MNKYAYANLIRETFPEIPLDAQYEVAETAAALHRELLQRHDILRCLTLTELLRKGFELEIKSVEEAPA